jgi:flagellar protein FlaG
MSISTSSVMLVAASASPQVAEKTAAQTVTGNVSVAAAGNTDSADKTKAKEVTAVTPEQIRQSLDDINVMLSARSVSVQFQIDPGYKDAILQVVDQHSGKVLLQLPSVEAVRIAKMTEQMKGVLIAQKV